MRLVGWSVIAVAALARRLAMWLLMPLFGSHGKHFRFDPRGCYSFRNIHVGDDVNLGLRPTIIAARSTVRIGNKVMLGPEVMIIGGGHNTREIGRAMMDVTEKRPDDDLGVAVEDDVWIGARAIILRGVRVGRGSVIGAGAVVTSDVPPYAIVAGCPARVLRFRWDVEGVLRHEELLYPIEKRLSRAELEAAQQSYLQTEN